MTFLDKKRDRRFYSFLQLAFAASVAIIAVLLLVNVNYGFLLFHSLAELFCVIVGITMSIVAWNTHQYTKNYFLFYLGIGYFWIAILDLFHMLTYNGMPFLNISSASISLHFWIYTRGFEALILLSASLFLTRQFNHITVFISGFVISCLLSYLAVYQTAPLFFIEGQGLTSAKIWSEYGIICILIASIFFYWRANKLLAPNIRFYLILSILLTIIAELFFTQYVSLYGVSNQIGHLLKIMSFLVIFLAIVQTMLKNPFSLLTLTAHSYDAIPQPAIIIDNSGIIRQVNSSAKSTFRISGNEGLHFHAASHDPNIDKVNCEICQHLTAIKMMPAKVFENLNNGTSYLISLRPLQFDDNQAGFIQIALDITKQIQEEKSLRLAGIIFNNMSEGIMVTDSNSNIISVNKAFSDITEYSEQEVLGKNPDFLASGRHNKGFFEAMWEEIDRTDHWKGDIWNQKKSGVDYPELLSIKALRGESREETRYVAVFSDISRLKSVENKLRHQAHHDSLTGLPNRLLFQNHLDAAIRHCKRSEKKLALFFIDLDNFKSINDSLGHSVGDAVLINVSKHIKNVLRDDDIVGRYGGDEFLVLIEDFQANEDLSYLSEKLINSLIAPIYHFENIPIFTSISIGICIFPDDTNSAEEAIQYADAAMYKAKKAGKNNFVFHASADNNKAKRRLFLESKLRGALARNEISVVYQPKVNAVTYEIVGAEALIRWNNNELGEIYPDEFIPLAESIGEIHKLGEFVLRQALIEVKKWRDLTNKNVSVAVNFSSKQFIRTNLDKLIEDALNLAQLPSEALEIEITESLLLEKSNIIKGLLESISNLGVKIAIDDFGTGFSSLSYLKNYPINVVKIDKSFIDGVVVSNEDAILVKTIILMSHGLNMSVVAEGVEDKEQLSFIQNEQGDAIQGYYFSKPLQKDDFINTLTNWDVSQYKT
jgi:diguanylate cyclase (GGDEF)-like protein/PAS domain S-box-containing protein